MNYKLKRHEMERNGRVDDEKTERKKKGRRIFTQIAGSERCGAAISSK